MCSVRAGTGMGREDGRVGAAADAGWGTSSLSPFALSTVKRPSTAGRNLAAARGDRAIRSRVLDGWVRTVDAQSLAVERARLCPFTFVLQSTRRGRGRSLSAITPSAAGIMRRTLPSSYCNIRARGGGDIPSGMAIIMTIGTCGFRVSFEHDLLFRPAAERLLGTHVGSVSRAAGTRAEL